MTVAPPVEPPTTVVTPTPPPPPSPPQVTQLTWARYDWTPSPSADGFVKTFDLAKTEGTKIVGNGAYVLTQATGSAPIPTVPVETVVNFRLANASAHFLPYATWEKSESASVLNGSLTVDFSNAAFQTELDVRSNRTGAQSISASGAISSTGNLTGGSANTSVTGGLTADRQEAAYAFEKLLPAGALRGVTLWGR